MTASVAVAVGGALGSLARYWTGVVALRLWGEAFPWATLVINVVGSLVIGAFGAATAGPDRADGTAVARLFVMVGVCGGFTTFSSFSLQTVDLLRIGRPLAAAAYIAASVTACLAATAAGVVLGRSLT